MSKKDNFKDKLHPLDKKILVISGILCVGIIALGIGLRVYISNRNNSLPVAEPKSIPSASSHSLDMSKYPVPEKVVIDIPKKSETDHIEETTDENGDYLKEQVIGKPDAPSEPPKLAEGADVTDPTKPPEYEKPSNTAPKDGDTRTENGITQTYIDGFGWLDGTGSGGRGEVADFELTGEQVGH